MSDQSGSFIKLRSHLFIEAILIIALTVYMVLAKSHVVGADFAFTAVGAALMAFVTYWTLSTVRDGIEVLAQRARANHL
ncbi:MAG: hypothetical protein WD623_03895 [Marinobacter sp.]|uniref:hypothetical protein n=1 Tax=Marinobacter sp. TaxID=50741 RepID=UPI0034A02C07